MPRGKMNQENSTIAIVHHLHLLDVETKKKLYLQRQLQELQTKSNTAADNHSKELEELRHEIRMERRKSAALQTQLEEKAKVKRYDQRRMKELTATVKLLKQDSITQHEERLELEKKLKVIKGIASGIQSGPSSHLVSTSTAVNPGSSAIPTKKWINIAASSTSSSSSSSEEDEAAQEQDKLSSKAGRTCKGCAKRFPRWTELRRHLKSCSSAKSAKENDSTNDDDDDTNAAVQNEEEVKAQPPTQSEQNPVAKEQKNRGRGRPPKKPENGRANERGGATAKLERAVPERSQTTARTTPLPAAVSKSKEAKSRTPPAKSKHSMSTRTGQLFGRTRRDVRFVDRNHQPHYFTTAKQQRQRRGSTKQAGRLQMRYYCKCGQDFDMKSTVFDHVLSLRMESNSK